MCNDLQFAIKTRNIIVYTNGELKTGFIDGSLGWNIRCIPTEGISLKEFKEGVKTFLNNVASNSDYAFTGKIVKEFEIKRKGTLLFVEEELLVNDEFVKFVGNSFRLDKHEFSTKLLSAGWEII